MAEVWRLGKGSGTGKANYDGTSALQMGDATEGEVRGNGCEKHGGGRIKWLGDGWRERKESWRRAGQPETPGMSVWGNGRVPNVSRDEGSDCREGDHGVEGEIPLRSRKSVWRVTGSWAETRVGVRSSGKDPRRTHGCGGRLRSAPKEKITNGTKTIFAEK